MDTGTQLARISRKLAASLDSLEFHPTAAHVYSPLSYAERMHTAYLSAYCRARPEVLILGMNPGPWGMAQTGIPFGEVSMVRDWLKIDEPIGKPEREHPKRPVLGLACPRNEVSGARLWGWARDTFGTPERFFERFFVLNYCPLCFMEAGGKNITPDKLPASQREPLLKICDDSLRESVKAIQPTWVIGVGGFAEKRARAALEGFDVRIGTILHPSPASPIANRGWAAQVNRQFKSLGIHLPVQNRSAAIASPGKRTRQSSLR
jgi:single-strand selective monofunctional uracil DNA glycosylase